MNLPDGETAKATFTLASVGYGGTVIWLWRPPRCAQSLSHLVSALMVLFLALTDAEKYCDIYTSDRNLKKYPIVARLYEIYVTTDMSCAFVG